VIDSRRSEAALRDQSAAWPAHPKKGGRRQESNLPQRPAVRFLPPASCCLLFVVYGLTTLTVTAAVTRLRSHPSGAQIM
jgi:hypothetical protein